MLIIIKTYQKQMSSGDGALQVGRDRKRPADVEEGIHGIPASSQHQTGTVTNQRLTGKCEGKA